MKELYKTVWEIKQKVRAASQLPAGTQYSRRHELLPCFHAAKSISKLFGWRHSSRCCMLTCDMQILVDMAADRGAFIDQSQSFNVHMSDVNFGKLTSLHFYAWKVWAATEQGRGP